jgi:hypothetical protein
MREERGEGLPSKGERGKMNKTNPFYKPSLNQKEERMCKKGFL